METGDDEDHCHIWQRLPLLPGSNCQLRPVPHGLHGMGTGGGWDVTNFLPLYTRVAMHTVFISTAWPTSIRAQPDGQLDLRRQLCSLTLAARQCAV